MIPPMYSAADVTQMQIDQDRRFKKLVKYGRVNRCRGTDRTRSNYTPSSDCALPRSTYNDVNSALDFGPAYDFYIEAEEVFTDAFWSVRRDQLLGAMPGHLLELEEWEWRLNRAERLVSAFEGTDRYSEALQRRRDTQRQLDFKRFYYNNMISREELQALFDLEIEAARAREVRLNAALADPVKEIAKGITNNVTESDCSEREFTKVLRSMVKKLQRTDDLTFESAFAKATRRLPRGGRYNESGDVTACFKSDVDGIKTMQSELSRVHDLYERSANNNGSFEDFITQQEFSVEEMQMIMGWF